MAGVDFLRVSGNNMDMQVVRRDTATFSLTWGGETPVDVTGYTASCIIKQSVDHSDSVAEFDVAVGNTDGLIAFSLDTVLPARFRACMSCVWSRTRLYLTA